MLNVGSFSVIFRNIPNLRNLYSRIENEADSFLCYFII